MKISFQQGASTSFTKLGEAIIISPRLAFETTSLRSCSPNPPQAAVSTSAYSDLFLFGLPSTFWNYWKVFSCRTILVPTTCLRLSSTVWPGRSPTYLWAAASAFTGSSSTASQALSPCLEWQIYPNLFKVGLPRVWHASTLQDVGEFSRTNHMPVTSDHCWTSELSSV